ncbi:hypothetical protein M0P65_04495 [Candidatus Gracilibacteria bacterium]|nr:hypothetical protein [Candidatus Gracilibacteria bacterium]
MRLEFKNNFRIMTTLTIKEDIKLSIKDFNTYDELVKFILYDNSIIEIEKLSKEEEKFISSLRSFKDFKSVAYGI